jgi:hypothetical protein
MKTVTVIEHDEPAANLPSEMEAPMISTQEKWKIKRALESLVMYSKPVKIKVTIEWVD